MDIQSPDASRQALEDMASRLESEADNGELEQKQEEPEQTLEPEAKVESEAPEPEPDDHSERSRLGRKFKRFEDEVVPKLSKLDKIDQMEQALNRLDQFAQALIQQAQQAPQPEEDEYIPTTKREMEEFLERREQMKQYKNQQARVEYEKGYLGTLKTLADDDDKELHEQVVELVTTPGSQFNRKHSENATSDALLNYTRAMRHVLKTSAAKPKTPTNPLRGGDPKTPLGTASTGSSTASTPVKLNPEAKAFIMSRPNPKTGKPYTDEEIRQMVK